MLVRELQHLLEEGHAAAAHGERLRLLARPLQRQGGQAGVGVQSETG